MRFSAISCPIEWIESGDKKMGLPLLREKRMSHRRELTGLLPGRLINAKGNDIECSIKDVSTHGMGFTSSVKLETGDTLSLKLKGSDLSLSVAWRQLGFGKRDQFRYGLTVSDPNIDLEKIFEEAGCLK